MSTVQETGSYIQSPESLIDKLGLTFTLKNITSKGATMVFELKNKETFNGLQYGADFSLQIEKDGKWEQVPTILKEFGVKAVAFTIPSEREINWSYLYGSLTPGIYRLSKGVTDVRLNSGPVHYTVYAKFKIN